MGKVIVDHHQPVLVGALYRVGVVGVDVICALCSLDSNKDVPPEMTIAPEPTVGNLPLIGAYVCEDAVHAGVTADRVTTAETRTATTYATTWLTLAASITRPNDAAR